MEPALLPMMCSLKEYKEAIAELTISLQENTGFVVSAINIEAVMDITHSLPDKLLIQDIQVAAS